MIGGGVGGCGFGSGILGGIGGGTGHGGGMLGGGGSGPGHGFESGTLVGGAWIAFATCSFLSTVLFAEDLSVIEGGCLLAQEVLFLVAESSPKSFFS